MVTKPIEPSYHSINQFFVVDDAPAFISFLVTVFDGIEARDRDVRADGTVDHADVAIGDSHVMISDPAAGQDARPSVSYAYVRDVDAVFTAAMNAGAELPVEPADRAWGDRVGGFTDPFKNRWWIATPKQWR
ncbi:VOC family protein [Rudaeicoccus suwonensis]|uniref:PhnB protein n=1 Tax=Rudaeicoccus suwonensis TaxID=657409 RepID=A0A561E450_9MICO|nr:VOC family protein [Rudaeicoccus suwonensis]TWE10396.1 PhnB protein [Rudaeicoccus suwonensis]